MKLEDRMGKNDPNWRNSNPVNFGRSSFLLSDRIVVVSLAPVSPAYSQTRPLQHSKCRNVDFPAFWSPRTRKLNNVVCDFPKIARRSRKGESNTTSSTSSSYRSGCLKLCRCSHPNSVRYKGRSSAIAEHMSLNGPASSFSHTIYS